MLDFDHIVLGNTVGDDYAQVKLSFDCLQDGISCSGGRHINDGSIAPGLLLSLSTVLKDGQAEVSAAGLLGGNSSNHLSAVVQSLLGLEGALVSSHSLADDLGVLVDPDLRGGTEHPLDGFRQHL